MQARCEDLGYTHVTRSMAKNTKDLQQTEAEHGFQRLKSTALWKLFTMLYNCELLQTFFKIIILLKAVLKINFLAGNFISLITDLCIIDTFSF